MFLDGLALAAINDIKGMRNSAAHSDINYNKNQAEFALEFVRDLLKRSKYSAND